MEVTKADYVRMSTESWIIELDPNMDVPGRFTVVLKPARSYSNAVIFDDSRIEEIIALLAAANAHIVRQRESNEQVS